MWIGERLEQYGIHKTENRRSGTDAERERNDGNSRKSRAMQELPHAITKVLKIRLRGSPLKAFPVYHKWERQECEVNSGRAVFAQLIEHLSHKEFQRCVATLWWR